MKGRDIALLLILGAVWGASFMFIKIILRDVSPLTLVGYRIGLGALGLLAFYAIDQVRRRQTGQPVESFPVRRLAIPSLILGVFNGIIPYLSITWGETYISSGSAAILNATTPLFATIFIIAMGRRAGGEQTSLTRVLGLIVGFAGVAVLVSGGGPEQGVSTENAWLGSAAILLASASYAVASLYARKAFVGVPVIYPAVGQNTAAALLLLPLTLLNPPQHGISGEGLLALLALGLGGTAFAYLIYFQLIARVGATRTVIVTYLLPGTALIYGALILSEPIHPIALSGLALVLLGIALTGGVFDRRAAGRAQAVARPSDVAQRRGREV